MAELYQQMPDGSTAETRRIAAENGGHLGLTREQAAEILKARGTLPPVADGLAPVRKPPETTPTMYLAAAGPLTPDEFSKMQLPPDLARVVNEELTETAGKITSDAVEQTYQHSSRSYAKDCSDAQILLDRSGSSLRATQLGPQALRLLATWAVHVSSRGPA